MDYVVENWFDYEINGKVSLSLFESVLNDEIKELHKIFEAIDVCNESSIILELNYGNIKEKVHTIIDKVVTLIKTIKKKISEKIDEIFNKTEIKDKFKDSDEEIEIHNYVIKNANISLVKRIDDENGLSDFKDLVFQGKQLKMSTDDDAIEYNTEIFKRGSGIMLSMEISKSEDAIKIKAKDLDTVKSKLKAIQRSFEKESDEALKMMQSLKKIIDLNKDESHNLKFTEIECHFYTLYAKRLETIVDIYCDTIKPFLKLKHDA